MCQPKFSADSKDERDLLIVAMILILHYPEPARTKALEYLLDGLLIDFGHIYLSAERASLAKATS